MNEFHLLRPYWLLLVLAIIPILYKLAKMRMGSATWQDACDAHLLPHLLTNIGHKSQAYALGILCLAWLLAIIALTGPTWSYTTQPVYQAMQSQVIVLDLSDAMYSTDIPPNRLTRAKYKVQDILKAKQDRQIGLIVFTKEPFLVSPLTEDAETIAAMVPSFSPHIMPIHGSHIAPALLKAEKLLQQAHTNSGEIMLLTAGPVTADDYDAAKQLRQHGYQLSIIGIGTTQGAPIQTQDGFLQNARGDIIVSKLDTTGLQQLANKGGGHYSVMTNDNRDIKSVMQNTTLSFQAKKTQRTHRQWLDQGRIFILLLLPLAALAFRRGWFETITQ